MATLNVYLADDLKARMSRHSLNWSQIAATAIETAINIEERKEVSMEQAALERLRAQRQTVAQQREADGEAKGKTWALSADYETLERVASIDLDAADYSDEGAIVYVLAAALLDDDRASRREVGDCIRETFGVDKISDDMASGFIVGAAAVFGEV